MAFEDCTPLLDNPEALRLKAEEDGFLFFKGFLPKEEVLELRREFLSILDKHGYLSKDAALMDGIGNLDTIAEIPEGELTFAGTGCPPAVYQDVQRLELFHSLPHHPKFNSLYEALLGSPVMPHPRHIARLMLPAKSNSPTPSHQDFIHIQGTKQVWTSWTPIGDAPRAIGNLTILKGSHKRGVLDIKAAKGAGGAEVWLCDVSEDWVEGDYEAGDIVTFNSLTVHKSLPPTEFGRVRLSCDYRFQSAKDVIDPSSLGVHHDVLDWEDVYKGWDSDALKYYWRKLDLEYSEWDESIRWQKENIC
ncbi:phytanoyl-CoA dioxygenase family protein [Pelagicoccus mobilis]|uniref:Phytanoyl-CoA dioxygenase family protein n=1 Tax=Pelagicoccus mobilis TaxID=415221 RepID=A0A934RZI6_9BACT|nr:phytanoyl-CoA dioxygenase family protein [Pelagicoccus mobilis]MBK1877182.1 phytanoyl-CoA dioxygenase family protein [Pelagicoccus mobilis]